MKTKPSFKTYLDQQVNNHKYFNSFSDVIDHHDDKHEDAQDKSLASDGKKAKTKKDGDKGKKHPDQETYHRTRFRHWMELSNSGD